MKETYKARIINISGDLVTYEYSDRQGFVQISSLRPTGIKVRVGDTVWITVENGEVISVGKRRKMFSTPFGLKLASLLFMIVLLLVLWLVFRVIKWVVITLAWALILIFGGIWLYTRFRK